MKTVNYAKKFYQVVVLDSDEIEGAIAGEQRIEIYEKNGDPAEMIGQFIKFEGCDCYQWRNIYGNVVSGKAYNETDLKAALKRGDFYPH